MQGGPTIANIPVVLVLAAFLVVFVVMLILVRRGRKGAKGTAAAGARVVYDTARQTAPDRRYAKRCPTCQSIYADETLAFCLSDGSTLERVAAPSQQRDPNATLVYADAPKSNLAPTVQSNPEEPPKS